MDDALIERAVEAAENALRFAITQPRQREDLRDAVTAALAEVEVLRATVARVEALADWHDTVAWLNGAGSRDVSRTHRDAAARLREALRGDE